MRILFNLAINSLLNRKITVFLTVISLTLSILLFICIDNLRISAKKSFFSSVKSGDLIVGSRSGEIQLLLYSLFQIGSPTNNISWNSYKKISENSNVDWIVPLSLGDSHKQFRVLGTNKDYFKRYTYRKNKKLLFKDGKVFNDLFDVVIGSNVALELNYKINDQIIIAHGISSQSLHDEFPFKVKGILKKTGTPVDRLVIVSLEALELIHKDWKTGARIPSLKTNKKKNLNHDNLEPQEITAALIKLNSKIKIFNTQREINNYTNEALQAIIPGVTLSKLWRIVSITENILLVISAMVIVSALIGMIAILYSTLNGRRKEMALLRVVGASPKTIFGLMIIEAIIISLVSIILAIIFSQIIAIFLFPILDKMFGIYLEYKFISLKDFIFFIIIILISFLVSLFPSYKALKQSIKDGI